MKLNVFKVTSFPDTVIYLQDIPIKLKAIPNEGYQFVNWQSIYGEITNSDSISVVLTGDSIINAIFVIFPSICLLLVFRLKTNTLV